MEVQTGRIRKDIGGLPWEKVRKDTQLWARVLPTLPKKDVTCQRV